MGGKDLLPPHRIQKGHLGAKGVLPRRMHTAEDGERSGRNEGGSKQCGREGMLHIPACIEQDGRHQKGVQPGIKRAPERAVHRKRRTGDIPSAVQKDKPDEKRHQKGVEEGDALRPLCKHGDGESKTAEREKRRKIGEKGIEPCEHGGAGNEGEERKGRLRGARTPAEERFERPAVSPVFLPEKEAERGEKTEQKCG